MLPKINIKASFAIKALDYFIERAINSRSQVALTIYINAWNKVVNAALPEVEPKVNKCAVNSLMKLPSPLLLD